MFSFGLENAADVRCCFRAAVTRPRRYPLTPEKLLDDILSTLFNKPKDLPYWQGVYTGGSNGDDTT
jgi:hypothetical protein